MSLYWAQEGIDIKTIRVYLLQLRTIILVQLLHVKSITISSRVNLF